MRDVSSSHDAREDPDRYLTLGDGREIEVKVRGSRFLGRALHAGSAEEARGRPSEVRRRYHDATHHGFAFRLGPPGRVEERFEDDGEPSGTAGSPILSALRGRRMHDGLVVVTRYFGGTKLGTGGLARAYGRAASEAIAAAPQRVVRCVVTLEVSCAYEDLGTIETLLARERHGGVAVERAFEDRPRLTIGVLRSRVDATMRSIVDATSGRAVVRRVARD